MGGGFLPQHHWEGPKSAPAAMCQETLRVALRHSWIDLTSLSPLEISRGVSFGGLSRPRVGVTAFSTQQSRSFWKHNQLSPRIPGMRGPSHVPSLLPDKLCLLHPGCALHLSFPLTTKSQPQKANFPCMCPELSGFS